MTYFFHRDYHYRVRRIDSHPITRRMLFTHEITLPDGTQIDGPFSNRYIVDRETFVEWVEIHLRNLDPPYGGWKYVAEEIEWSRGKPSIRHWAIGPDDQTVEIPHYTTRIVLKTTFERWIDWNRPDPSLFGGINVTERFLDVLDELAKEHGATRDQHEQLAVLYKLGL